MITTVLASRNREYSDRRSAAPVLRSNEHEQFCRNGYHVANYTPEKSDSGKVSRVRHMVPGGSRESLPKRKVRLADQPDITQRKRDKRDLSTNG